MDLQPEQIPDSFKIYFDQFDENPDAVIEKLEQHVVKRNIGAIGYFFLAWFYQKNGQIEKAVQNAWTAKIHAPGSLLMDKLHYYLSHPNEFEAWKPERTKAIFKKTYHSEDKPHMISNLDSLISKLSSVEAQRIRLKEETSEKDATDLGEKSAQTDDIVTETLALIYEKQGNYSAAINAYKKLRSTNVDRQEYYNEEIFRLKELESKKN